MFDLPDHPVIRALEATGYPDWEAHEPDLVCEVCGEHLYEDEVFEDHPYSIVCLDCLLSAHRRTFD